MKVLHTEWSDGWGGQEIRIINEMIAVREKGIEVFLACRDNSIIKQKALENNIEVFILPFRGNVDFKTLFTLIKLIKKHKIDIVNTHSGKDTWVGGLAAKFTGAKFIRTRHLSNRIKTSKLNFINELADFVFTTGESVREDMIKYNRIKPEKILSIPTGIDSEIFNIKNFDINEEKRKLNILEDEISIGIVAVLREFKRHEVFLQIATKLVEKYKNIKFFIAGDGPRKEIIERIIENNNLKDKVIMLGHINNPQNLLAVLDIFILTSDCKEGVPQSVNQALMSNTCVIATDIGSTRDLYHNDNFFLVEPNEPNKVISIIDSLINDKTKLEKYKCNSREFVYEKFSLDSMCNKILEVYDFLIRKR